MHFFWSHRTGLLLGSVVVLGVLLVTAVAPSRAQLAESEKMNRMDHGPFVTATITEDPLAVSEILTYKGIAVRVGSEEDPATMVFDTDLMRVAAGWTGGFLHWYPARTSLQEFPTPDGFIRFETAQGPGWSPTGRFEDPRSWPYGPLPEDWASYEGLYMRGDTVVFSYRVGDTDVLEMPSFERVDGQPVFTRTIEMGPHEESFALRVIEAPEGSATSIERVSVGDSRGYVRIEAGSERRLIGFRGLSEKSSWRLEHRHLILELAATAEPRRFALHVGPVLSGSETAFMEDRIGSAESLPNLQQVRRPGPATWEPVRTRAKTADETGEEGPFAVDDLTLPVPNPWNSYLRLSGIDFLSDGRAVVSSLSGDVWVVSGIQGALDSLTWTRYASGLYQPLGVEVVGDTIYVTGRDQITRLLDRNGDGEADYYQSFNNEVMASRNFHAFVMNLETDSEGNFYFSKSTPWPPYLGGHGPPRNAESTPHHGVLFRAPPSGDTLEIVATGLRNPNGLAIGPDDRIAYSDQQGNWVPTSNVQLITEGGFHGFKPSAHGVPIPGDPIDPIVWLPHAVDNSPGDPIWITSERWPEALQGQLLQTSYGQANLSLLLTDAGDGSVQGGLINLPLEFDSGLMRGAFHENGHLYVAGMTSWQSVGDQPGSFHRVRYTGRPLDLPTGFDVKPGGIRIEFGTALDPTTATDTSRYELEQWTYRWMRSYGSPRYSVEDPDRQGTDAVEVADVRLSEDGRSVFLEIPEIRPVMNISIDYRLETTDGAEMDRVIYGTIHRIPRERAAEE